MAKTIVVIHGVGPSAPSVIGHQLANTLGLEITQQKTICVKNETFIEFVDTRSDNSIVEVNWADLLKPKRTVLSIISHFWYLITSMVDVAVQISPFTRSPFTKVYRWLLFVISPGALLYMITTGIAVSICDQYQRLTLLGFTALALFGFMVWARKMGAYFYWLGIWSILIVILGIYCWYEPLPLYHPLIKAANTFRYISFASVLIFLPASVLESWFKLRKFDVRITHAALRFIPFIVMNGFMTWLTYGYLGFIKNRANAVDYDNWEKYVTPQYDYALVEKITTIVIGSIGILGLILPLLGFYIGLGNLSQKEINKRGRGFQNGLITFLTIAAIALILLALVSVYISRTSVNHGVYLYEIYQISVLRTLPYLAWTIGPLSLLFDVLGDILFYLEPNKTHPVAIAEKCQNRLKEALFYAQQKSNQEIIVLAHSQGSVIAAALKAQGILTCPLVTIGSPVGSLYERFLGIPQQGDKQEWLNLYRDGDFIAGPIPGVNNTDLHIPGYHTDYWIDPILTRYIKF